MITLVDEHRDELEARDQFNRGLAAALLEESQELSAAKDTISALQQQVASLEQQLLSTPQVPPQQQPAASETTTTSWPSYQHQQQQQLEAALSELESLRGQLADVTSRQQQQQLQQQAATEAAVVAEVAELRQLAAEVEPLRQRAEAAESAAEALRLQAAAVSEQQQLRRQLEASRGQQQVAAVLQLRLAAAEKEAAEARSKHKTRKIDHNILIWKYDKLIAEKIVLERLYDVLCTREQLDLQFVVESVVETHDELRGLGEAAEAWRRRREQYRREAKMYGNTYDDRGVPLAAEDRMIACDELMRRA
ncbi:hypothetical protein PLESTB_001443800 [Pleodorina starrii]|uniref:Uncharacterized protein n=1 Tax=Pleodorina starrii TaxID=330485 RepID=A0A9W6F7D6_9CHLO|nr:hypothetical protein PLESTB_001443800 [Pleodorina starrii]